MKLTLREQFIILVDNDKLVKSDAIVLLEGDGLFRLDTAIQLFQQGYADKLVFSGGIVNHEYGSFPFEDFLPGLIERGIPNDAIIHEKLSKNTKEQAEYVFDLAIKNNWTRLILVASHYHQYRAYLTFLKQFIIGKHEVQIFNAPARSLDWFSENEWGVRFNLLEQEFERISKYSKLNHLATIEEAITYQKWKEHQLQEQKK